MMNLNERGDIMSYCKELIRTFDLLKNTEVWKDIIYKDIRRDMYMVSSFGRVKNKHTGVILKQFISRGYCILELAVETPNHGRSFPVHRLVATAFIPNIFNKREVNHIDGDKTNNHMENLEWVTSSENQIHAFKMGLQKTKYGEESPLAKITNDDVHFICKTLVKYNGDLSKTMDECSPIQHLTYSILKTIKLKINWCEISDLYFDEDTFDKVGLPDEIVHFICENLVNYNGDINKVLKVTNDKFPKYDIHYRTIQSIRSKQTYCSISDMYFAKQTFTQTRSDSLSIDDVTLICRILVKHCGNIDDTIEELADLGYKINRWVILNIRRGEHYKNISEKFFEYSKGVFSVKTDDTSNEQQP